MLLTITNSKPLAMDALAPINVIAYDELSSAAMECLGTDRLALLRKQLQERWLDVYVATTGRSTNIHRYRVGNFEYICDLYSRMEIGGGVAFDQTVQDRVVAVVGTSARVERQRSMRGSRRWPDESEHVLESERDNGHFIARCLGGGPDVNLFSQERKLNRGWSAQGKVFREMERYCHERPGTFCFSRPIYADQSNVPRWLEFGVLKDDQTLWVETFEN